MKSIPASKTGKRVRRQTISEAAKAARELAETPGFQLNIASLLLSRWLDDNNTTIAETAKRFFAEEQAAYEQRMSPEARHRKHRQENERSFQIECAEARAAGFEPPAWLLEIRPDLGAP